MRKSDHPLGERFFQDPRARPESNVKALAPESEIILESLDAIESKPVRWLWPDRFPKPKLSICTGNPDEGKTTVLGDLTARVTTRAPWPDGTPNDNEPMDVLWMAAEDDPADTIKPRLQAAGADMSRVHLLKFVRVRQGAKKLERAFALDEDLAHLECALAARPKIGLVIIDPITSYLGKADLNKEQELRRVLVPIKELCERTGVTFIGAGHFNKRGDVSALHRVGGAVAMTGVARAVWLFVKNPEVEGERLMLLAKNNLSKKRTGLRYRIVEKQIEIAGQLTGQPIIEWLGDAEASADSVLEKTNNPEEKKRSKAEAFLRKALADGARPSEELLEEGNALRIGRGTLFTAKKELGVRAIKIATRWWWELSPKREGE